MSSSFVYESDLMWANNSIILNKFISIINCLMIDSCCQTKQLLTKPKIPVSNQPTITSAWETVAILHFIWQAKLRQVNLDRFEWNQPELNEPNEALKGSSLRHKLCASARATFYWLNQLASAFVRTYRLRTSTLNQQKSQQVDGNARLFASDCSQSSDLHVNQITLDDDLMRAANFAMIIMHFLPIENTQLLSLFHTWIQCR